MRKMNKIPHNVVYAIGKTTAFVTSTLIAKDLVNFINESFFKASIEEVILYPIAAIISAIYIFPIKFK